MGQTELHFSDLHARASDLRLAVVAGRYNPRVADSLLEGALGALRELGLSEGQVEIFRVPGAFELPLLAKELAQIGSFDAIVCLGAVIRGDTSHFDYVCEGVTQGLMQAMLQTQVPMAFGVLTTEDEAQALARSGRNEHNKGREAALTAVEMALLQQRIRHGKPA
ncbi:MAG TPA: 6,7-dimethyl-8-ribityllumazine synthase [Deltaproteobacteria bacterium]|nr:6,7-dimethyl-8-ribityllumazine synthase [Deltaproteobacteria bacterium]